MDAELVNLLVRAVAHDFNNLLTVIGGNSEMLLKDSSLPPGARQLARETLKAGQQAGLLCAELYALSQHVHLPDQEVNVHAVIRAAEDMLRRLVGDNIKLVLALGTADGFGFVKLVPGQLERVLVNLALNARDAMPLGGTLRISTTQRETQAADPVSYVRLTVSDTGQGMAAETRARLFEPHFTTKGSQGKGLGLAAVRSIVERAGGHIDVESKPGWGTEFHIDLPESVSLQA